MGTRRRALGRGLSSLIPDAPPPAVATAPKTTAPDEPSGATVEIDLDRIRPGEHQPRTRFLEEKVDELAQSIRESGVIQPVVVFRDGDGYRLVAGERRWRAAQRAGLLRIPALVREVPEEQRLQLSLVENLQREDLNPMEEARAYRALIRELGLTQAEVARRVGRARSAVSNQLRLLELPPRVQEKVESGELAMGHARALLALEKPEDMHRLAEESVRLGLSAREVERRVKAMSSRPVARPQEERVADPNLAAAEMSLARALSTRVHIRKKRSGSGRVEIHFAGDDELQRIYELLAGKKL